MTYDGADVVGRTGADLLDSLSRAIRFSPSTEIDSGAASGSEGGRKELRLGSGAFGSDIVFNTALEPAIGKSEPVL